MQPLQPQGASPPVPHRWAEALRNVEAAQLQLDDLARQLDSALYLDEEAWRQAVPQAQFTAALQGQQRKIAELEAQLAAVVARLEDSERARRAAEARVVELSGEVENHGSVFRLHYEELLRKDREISDLQAVIQALLGSDFDDY
ncbi:hypothetical protein ABPG75_008708 [Micractinium tetrahymenae]